MALWHFPGPGHHYDMDPFENMFEVPQHMMEQWSRNTMDIGRATEIQNTSERFKINLNVEGFRPDELHVKCVRDRFLVVSGRKQAVQTKGGVAEAMSAQEFTRSFMVPRGVDIHGVKSRLTGGVLSIEAPKVNLPAIQNERLIAIEQD